MSGLGSESNWPRSFTLKGSETDVLSVTIGKPEFTLLELRQKAGAFLTQKDRFLNKNKAPVSNADEQFAISTIAADGDIILIKRFVEPVNPTPTEPVLLNYTVKRGQKPTDSRSAKIDAAAHLTDLRQQLTDFMKAEYYFMDQKGGKITLEDKYRVGEIAEKDTNIIQIGPTTEPLKPPTTPLPTTDVPALPTRTWNLTSPTDSTDLLPTISTGSGTPGTLTAQEYYTIAEIKTKKQLFKKVGLDRGFIVKSDPNNPFVQSSLSPAWYVPSDQGPASSTPAEPDTRRVWAAATKVISEMRKRGINQAALNGSWSDATGLNGLSLRSSFTRDLEEYGKAVTSEIYILEERAVRKVTLTLSNEDLRPTASFKAKVDAVVNSSLPRIQQYERLHSEVFANYGHFFPTQVVLGGKWVKEYSEISSDKNEQSRLMQEIKVGGDGRATTEDGTFGLGLAYGNYSEELNSLRVIKQLKTQVALKTGGLAAAGIDKDEGPWVNSLALMGNWEVIDTLKMLPIISLLEGDAAADDLRRQCLSLINEFATNSISVNSTALDMESYVAFLHAREAEKMALI